MVPPRYVSLRVAVSPLKGALPVARQSRFHGSPGMEGRVCDGHGRLLKGI
jgi:hypothetical protein